jgi:hypothetical protein
LEEQERKLKRQTVELRREREGVEGWLRKNEGKGGLSQFDDLEGVMEGLLGEVEGLEAMLGLVDGEEEDWSEDEGRDEDVKREGEDKGEGREVKMGGTVGGGAAGAGSNMLEDQAVHAARLRTEGDEGARAARAEIEANGSMHAARGGVEERLEDLHVSDNVKGKQRAV